MKDGLTELMVYSWREAKSLKRMGRIVNKYDGLDIAGEHG
jgi:hypothetical protein